MVQRGCSLLWLVSALFCVVFSQAGSLLRWFPAAPGLNPLSLAILVIREDFLAITSNRILGTKFRWIGLSLLPSPDQSLWPKG